MRVRFTKMQGAGNDFVVLDATRGSLDLSSAQIKTLADRRFGVGADQILVVDKATRPGIDFGYRIFNGGSGDEVEHCGNGARCFVRFVRDKGLSDKKRLVVETMNRRLELRLQGDGRVSVDMGPPDFDTAHVPFDITWLAPRSADSGLPLWPVEIGDGRTVDLAVVSMGNPHAVQIVADVDAAPVATLGPRIERHVRFAQGVNAGGINKQFYIFQVGASVYDVAIDFNANGGIGTTTVTGPGNVITSYTGIASGQPAGGSGGNGSIFINGNVTIAGGTDATGLIGKSAIGATVHGSYTIGVPDYITNHADSITLNKSITDLDASSSSNDVLALWANDIKLSNNADAAVDVDALMLTGYYGECTIAACNDGTLYNKSCTASTCGGGAGRTLNILGSLVENIRGKLGTAVVGQTSCATGFCRRMMYDQRLGSRPPPFSPTTNKYQIIALQYK